MRTTYLTEGVNNAEILISVAIIVIAHKVIIFEIKGTSDIILMGTGSIIIALLIGTFLFNISGINE